MTSNSSELILEMRWDLDKRPSQTQDEGRIRILSIEVPKVPQRAQICKIFTIYKHTGALTYDRRMHRIFGEFSIMSRSGTIRRLAAVC